MPDSLRDFFLCMLGASLLSSCSGAPKKLPPTVASLDLKRYMGRWYVVRNVPYFLEKGKVASYDTYGQLADGRLSNDFTFRRNSLEAPEVTWKGFARVLDHETNATWKVSFVWPLSVTYKVFALAPDYHWAVVGTKDAGLLWVLCRQPSLPEKTYETIVAELQAKGISTEKLAPVPQRIN